MKKIYVEGTNLEFTDEQAENFKKCFKATIEYNEEWQQYGSESNRLIIVLIDSFGNIVSAKYDDTQTQLTADEIEKDLF